MKRSRSLSSGRWGIIAGTTTAAIVASTIIVAGAEGGKTGKSQAPGGADLYASNCMRCHAERYAKERTDAQWKTLILHMRVRAQLTGQDAKKVLSYLQESN